MLVKCKMEILGEGLECVWIILTSGKKQTKAKQNQANK